MFAIIQTGGKQIKVETGDTIYVEKLEVKVGQNYTFDKVLMIDNKIGNPFLENASVTAEVEKHGKQKKIIVFKYKAKSNRTKKQWHRQPYTRLVIKEISASQKKAVVKKPVAKKPAKAVAKEVK